MTCKFVAHSIYQSCIYWFIQSVLVGKLIKQKALGNYWNWFDPKDKLLIVHMKWAYE